MVKDGSWAGRAAALLLVLTPVAAVAANSSQSINIQGVLRDASGALQSMAVGLDVNFYDSETATTPFFTHHFTTVPVDNGFFAVEISDSSLSFSGLSDAWAGIQVAGDATELPRQHIAAVPFAMSVLSASSAATAASADTLSGAMPISNGVTFDGTVALNSRVTFGPKSGLAATKVLAYASVGYPRTANFTSNGGTLLLMASGSAFSTAAGIMEVDILVDGTARGSMSGYTNEVTSHKALVSETVVLAGLAAGAHKLELRLIKGSADTNDYSQVTVLELPL
jgi:hypothetical protein